VRTGTVLIGRARKARYFDMGVKARLRSRSFGHGDLKKGGNAS
jgi:hypothetical protein